MRRAPNANAPAATEASARNSTNTRMVPRHRGSCNVRELLRLRRGPSSPDLFVTFDDHALNIATADEPLVTFIGAEVFEIAIAMSRACTAMSKRGRV